MITPRKYIQTYKVAADFHTIEEFTVDLGGGLRSPSVLPALCRLASVHSVPRGYCYVLVCYCNVLVCVSVMY